jgi:hypothetical protein
VLGVEFRLLRAERSLVVVLPLGIVLSVLEVAFYNVAPEFSYSAAYAYVFSIGTAAGLFSLYSNGYNHWALIIALSGIDN